MANKLNKINPNQLNGSGLFVPYEDLTISVELTCEKKGRTILLANGANSTSESSQSFKLNFIEGSNVGNQKVLTTNYTNLTALNDDANVSENLGITSIDIDFNSSFAPLVTIQFVDVRGSAIFQNENNVKEGTNKFSSFFELPYPLYKLKIKGYYGQPVEYCLHMTKFTSRFNSQSGNFEITASFVGYTYAMLSDIIIGFLKAIPYTDIGSDIYKDPRFSDVNTVDEFYDAISNINTRLEKLKSSSDNYKNIETLNKNNQILDTLNDNIRYNGNIIDLKKGLNNYPYFIFTDFENLAGRVKNQYIDIIKDYSNDNILKNEINNLAIKSTTFSNAPEQLKNYLNQNNYNIATGTTFNYVDNNKLLNTIDALKLQNIENIKSTSRDLSSELKEEIKKNIGFEPTIRNVFNIFTTAAEVFMRSIFNVSQSAIKSDSRKNQLQKFKNKKNYDYTKELSNNLSSADYYPWPDYREGSQENGYQEVYLGKKGVLTNPTDVDELKFIENLLNAFIISAKVQQQIDIKNGVGLTLTYPTNVFDSYVVLNDFVTDGYKNPYDRHNFITTDELLTVFLIRAMTFLSLTNEPTTLKIEEIENMAKSEANSIKNTTTLNNFLIESLKNIKIEDIDKIKGSINGFPKEVVKKTFGDYTVKYDYFVSGFDDGTVLLSAENYFYNYLPINKNFFPIFNGSVNLRNLANDTEFIYLNNYIFNENYPSPTTKDDTDKSKFIYFIEPANYYNSNVNVNNPVNEPISLQALINGSSDAYNFFNGVYGIQQFTDLIWDSENTVDINLPLRYVFYNNIDKPSNLYNNHFSNKFINIENNIFSKVFLKNNDSQLSYQYVDFWSEIISNDVKNYREELNKTLKNYGKNYYLLNASINNNDNDITFPFTNFIVSYQGKVIPISLFGSRFYNYQTNDKSKAFLFLHSISWDDLTNTNNPEFGYLLKKDGVIYNLFSKRGGFISAPKLWAAFVGALLWRYDTVKIDDLSDPILFKKISNDINLIPLLDSNYTYPSTEEFISYETSPFNNISFNDTTEKYKKIDKQILNLPYQAREEFKKQFDNFVENDWLELKNYLELNLSADWDDLYGEIYDEFQIGNDIIEINKYKEMFGDDILDKYQIINPYNNSKSKTNKGVINNLTTTDLKYNYFLMLRDDSEGVKKILDLLKEEVIIANSSYRTWTKQKPINYFAEFGLDDDNNLIDLPDNKTYYLLEVSNFNGGNVINVWNTYITSFLNEFKDYKPTQIDENNQIKQNLFGTSDENIIKLMLYRTCKNLYDKWIGGLDNPNKIFFQCSLYDSGSVPNKTLIDTFRFVSRSFEDIGDILAINPYPIHDSLRNSPNTSLYELLTSVLSANYFDFIALPSFINYNDKELLKQVFQTYPSYNNDEITAGPSFVCVYLGQKSKHLDIPYGNYPNDGFDFKEPPIDFNKDTNDENETVAYFEVNFGEQNQNIFKDVILDQSEFAETAESLQIIDDIANKGSQTNITLAGQNLYNVYSVRSYKVEVEMLGNAMIQPMMYFQLNNIPMFHGAYMIIRVKHSIKPNHMITSFTGSRIRAPKTEIFSTGSLYMSLLGSINATDIIDLPITETNTIQGPVFDDNLLILNTTQNPLIDPFSNDKKNVVISSIPGLRSIDGKDPKVHKGVDFSLNVGTPLLAIYDGTIEYLKNDPNGFGLYVVVNHGVIGDKVYKTLYGHVSNLNENLFGYKLPLDNNEQAGIINNINGGYNLEVRVKKGDTIGYSGGKQKTYFIDKDKKFDTAGFSTGPHLHFELRVGEKNELGKSIFNLQYTDPIPYLPLKDYARYKEGNIANKVLENNPNIQTGDLADFWSLVAICSLEAGSPQSRADVAQSIYNRLLLPNKAYGASIKQIIVKDKQYSPTNVNISDWYSINSYDSAVTAIKNSKNWDDFKTKKNINESLLAIVDNDLSNNAKNFIQSRTSFVANSLTIPQGADGIIQRKPLSENNQFFWIDGGLNVKNMKPFNAPDWINKLKIDISKY